MADEDAWLLGGGKGKGKGKGKAAKKGERGRSAACGSSPAPGPTRTLCKHAACRMLAAVVPSPAATHRSLPLRPPAHPLPACTAEEKKVAGPEKLTHSLDILEAFATLKLEVGLGSVGCLLDAGALL